MNGLPEWFVGGPWHGKDRRIHMPEAERDRVYVAYQPTQQFTVDYSSLTYVPDASMPMTEQMTYVAKSFVVFDTVITAWVPENDLPDLRESGPLLRELIMKPHADETPEPLRFDSAKFGESLRDDFMRHHENESRENRLRQLHRTVDQLQGENRELREYIDNMRNHDGMVPTGTADGVPSGALTIRTEDVSQSIAWKDILTYWDAGNDEHSPAWCATVQGEGGQRAYFGYGPDPTGAIIALLADYFGYYAQIRQYEEAPIGSLQELGDE